MIAALSQLLTGVVVAFSLDLGILSFIRVLTIVELLGHLILAGKLVSESRLGVLIGDCSFRLAVVVVLFELIIPIE